MAEEAIRPDDTAGSLTERLSLLGAGLLVKALEGLDKLMPVKQDSGKATNAPILKKEMGLIDWTRPAVEIERLVRGLDPWPGAYTIRAGEALKVWRASVNVTGIFSGGPGEVVDVNNNGIKVMTGGDVLVISELQAGGGRRMRASEYLAGHEVKVGEKLV
jgi:methionyl-tRNA formyltransferase